MNEKVRIDKWLWAVRVFKTRSKATKACRKGRVLIDDLPVKPSHGINAGEVVKVKETPIIRSYKVLVTAEKRMSSKLTSNFIEDITPEEELNLIKIHKQTKWINRERGMGRPTKKERREMDDFFNNTNN